MRRVSRRFLRMFLRHNAGCDGLPWYVLPLHALTLCVLVLAVPSASSGQMVDTASRPPVGRSRPALPKTTRGQSFDCNQGRATYPDVDPRDQQAICLPDAGTMVGTIGKAKLVGGGEEFGRTIIPTGDLNGDSLADFALTHIRCDTPYYRTPDDQYPKQPVELLLYHGVRGGLPKVESGERIGPTEIESSSMLIATGDFDADGHKDLVVRIQILGDTSFGNTNAGRDISRLVVFWGQSNGHFSIDDTTQLQCGADIWIGPWQGLGSDFDHDSVDDLLIYGGGGLTQGKGVVGIPQIMIYRGGHERWGRNGRARFYDWSYWNAPQFTGKGLMRHLIDQDCDGVGDLVIDNVDGTFYSTLAILYGKLGHEMFDTTGIETIDVKYANGHSDLFEDVTGDGVPELILSCGSQNKYKVYAGRPGQRLRQQFGPDSLPNTPWAEVWRAPQLNPDWYADDGAFDLGDINLDGVNDIVGYGWPYIVCYVSGRVLDSLIDALVYAPQIEGAPVNLGDIDGSGLATYVYPFDDTPHDPVVPFPGGLSFFKPSKSVPAGADRLRELPHPIGFRCEHAASQVGESVRITAGSSSPLTIEARPNPSSQDVTLSWTGTSSGEITIMIVDVSGREIYSTTTESAPGRLVWNTAGVPPGTYVASMRTESGSTSCSIILER